MNVQELKPIVEAILMAAEEPVSIERLGKLLEGEHSKRPPKDALNETLVSLQSDYVGRGVELAEVASGFRIRARAEYAEQVSRMWEERKPRYTRAFLETLAIIAYRQPITRGEIEHIRGVAVSSNIMRQLLEREWVRVVGHRDVPGRPSVYATTDTFLDYFGLKSLDGLPTLADLKDIDAINIDLFAATIADERAPDVDETVGARDDDHATGEDPEQGVTDSDPRPSVAIELVGEQSPGENADLPDAAAIDDGGERSVDAAAATDDPDTSAAAG